jgi:hypothetical protein
LGHLRESGLGPNRAIGWATGWAAGWAPMRPHLGTAGLGAVLVMAALSLRAPEGVHALTHGTPLSTLTRTEFLVSGAASGVDVGAARIRFASPLGPRPQTTRPGKETADATP